LLQTGDRASRRELLKIASACGLAFGSLGAHRKLAAANSGEPAAKARSCIVLFLMGGPSQHSTWDPKPRAAVEVRGELKPISTSVPGIEFGELLPKTARLAEHLCILRAMHTGDNAHSSSGYFMMTGVPHQPMNAENVNPGFPNDWPNFGATVRRLKPESSMPAAARLPHQIFNTDGSIWPGGPAARSAEPPTIAAGRL
jgi:hypothetical protein